MGMENNFVYLLFLLQLVLIRESPAMFLTHITWYFQLCFQFERWPLTIRMSSDFI